MTDQSPRLKELLEDKIYDTIDNIVAARGAILRIKVWADRLDKELKTLETLKRWQTKK